jgi:hypothetical protein
VHDCECLMSYSLRDPLATCLPCEFVKSAWQCLLHLSVQADVLDTLSLRDHLITDFLLSTVIL